VRSKSLAIVLTIALVAYFAALFMLAQRDGNENRRSLTLLSLGGSTATVSGDAESTDGNLAIRADGGEVDATWNEYAREIGQLLSRAKSCSMSVAIVGVGLTSPDERGTADILVNGEPIERLTFSSARRGLYPFAGSRLVPANAVPQLIELVPLDAEYGFLVPVPQRYCSAHTISIGVRVRGASWTIAHAGVVLDYTPAPFSTRRGAIFVALGTALIALGIFCLYAILHRMSALGTASVAATTILLMFAPLTHDQWDFRLWAGFGEFAVFGGGDPATLWYGSPLWTFVPSLFSAMTAAMFVSTGHGSLASTSLFMKVGMGLAYCYTAYQIAARAPAKARKYTALVALLVPVGLFELAGGYRELFAAALAVTSLSAAVNRRLVFSTILSVAAASISEEFLPLTLLAASISLASARPVGARFRTAVILAAVAVVLFLAEWQLLIPHDIAAHALGYRFGRAPLGGASWAGALQSLNVLPGWLPVQSPLFGAFVLVALAVFPTIRLWKILFRANTADDAERSNQIVGIFVAYVAAFLLAFRGTDPNLWYSMTAIALWYFAFANPFNPFPLLLGAIEGLSFYATVGFREFVNQAYLWPVDRGVVGTLSTLRFVFDLMTCGLLLAFLIAMSLGNTRRLFSRKTPLLGLVFFASALASANDDLFIDALILIASTILVGRALAGYVRRDSEVAGEIDPRASGVQVVLFAILGAHFGLLSGLAAFAAAALCVFAARNHLHWCDVILGGGAIATIGSQSGAGVISRLGDVLLIVLLIGVIFNAFDDSRRTRNFESYAR
jgi:hypothetical protein